MKTPQQADKIELACRHCGARNRVNPVRAARHPDTVRCGGCSGELLVPATEPLIGLEPAQLAHPLDRKTLAALRAVPGIETVLRKVLSELSDRHARMLHLASYVRVGERQFPDIYALYQQAGQRLDVDEMPDLFVYQDPRPNAYTFGVDQPVLAVSTALIELLDEDELLGVLGHELTHWICDHSLYRTAARIILTASSSLLGNFFKLGMGVAFPVQMALLEWYRASELTADRGELLCTGNLDTALTALMKIAGAPPGRHGLSVDAFLEQAEALDDEADQSILGKVYAFFMGSQSTHPLAVWRARHLARFAHSEEYLEILAGRYQRRLGAG